MKKPSPILISLMVVTMLAIAFCLLYAYLFSTLSEMSKEQAAATARLGNPQIALREEEGNKEKLAAYFVTEGEQAEFVSSIESLCRQLSLFCEIQSLSEAPDPSGTSKVLSTVISAEGSLENITALLKSFETSAYPVILTKTLLTRAAQDVAASSTPSGWHGTFDINIPVLIKS
jgi:hypothetical protein